MPITSRHFYQFSGFHSLLIGLLPFFLPVLLWNNGASLSQISAFIALTGIGFIATLWYWDKLRASQRWKKIIVLSLISELLLLLLLTWSTTPLSLAGLALINGAYNCFYWSTQRAMFSQITSTTDTGRTFGNFQILVVILLKLGILVGGYLLENESVFSIVILSMVISSFALWHLTVKSALSSDQSYSQQPRLKLKDITRFKDNKHSRLAFLLDGPFLFLESYFWILSLYFLSQESFLTLGIVIVSLTLLLSLIFYFIKNNIDKAEQQKIFSIAVFLYAFSWLLRSQINTESDTNNVLQYATILIIGFLTSFFRLVFNKRFFDIAQRSASYKYLIYKSYYSQFGIAVFFGALAIAISNQEQTQAFLSTNYLWACPLALLYGIYGNGAFPSLTQYAISKQSLIKHYLVSRHSRLLNKR